MASEVTPPPTPGTTECYTPDGGSGARVSDADRQALLGALAAYVRPGPVLDLLEEMVQRTVDDEGQVTVIRDAPVSVAAKLRFPLTGEGPDDERHRDYPHAGRNRGKVP